MNILLAEDNPVNQEVAVGLLEKLDCIVTLAENGVEAVNAARDGDFNLLLMDYQMPVMDGLDATRAIRQAEADDRRLPIVALTANNSEGVRAQCLAAGMDDFLGKPFSYNDLQTLLQRWCPGLDPAPQAEPAATVERGASSLDLAPIEILSTLDPDGERNLVQRAITKFMDYSEELMIRFADAVGQGDAAEVSRIAHSFKSSSANLGATALAQHCADIEKLAADGRMPDDIDEKLLALQTAHRAAKESLLLLIEGE